MQKLFSAALLVLLFMANFALPAVSGALVLPVKENSPAATATRAELQFGKDYSAVFAKVCLSVTNSIVSFVTFSNTAETSFSKASENSFLTRDFIFTGIRQDTPEVSAFYGAFNNNMYLSHPVAVIFAVIFSFMLSYLGLLRLFDGASTIKNKNIKPVFAY